MRMIKTWKRGILAAVLAASMAAPGIALADGPAVNEELEELLESMEEQSVKSLLSKDLQWEILDRAMDKNGLEFTVDLGLTQGTADALNLTGVIPEDGRMTQELVIDPKWKKWQVGAELIANGEVFLDLLIYADSDMLALEASRLFDGALAIRSGSFKRQFEGSALARLLEIEGEIPDFFLKFYPGEHDFDFLEELTDQEYMEEKTEHLMETMRVEKSQEGAETVYTAYFPTREIMSIQQRMMELYLDLFRQFDLISSYDRDIFEKEYEEALDQMVPVIGEEIPISFHAEGRTLKRLTYQQLIEPDLIEQGMSESGAAGQDGNESGMAEPETELIHEMLLPEASVGYTVVSTSEVQADKEGGIFGFEIVFEDDSDPYRNFSVSMTSSDLQGNEQTRLTVTKTTQRTETSESMQISLTAEQEGEVIYSGTPIWSEYDAQTGDLNAAIAIEQDGSEVALRLDSTITKETGAYTAWQIDRLAMEVDGEAIGLQGEVRLSAQPRLLTPPDNLKMLLEMGEGALQGLLTEISYNVEAMTPEPEYEAADSYGTAGDY